MDWKQVDQNVRGLWRLAFYVVVEGEQSPFIFSADHYGDQHSVVHSEQNWVSDLTGPKTKFIGVQLTDPCGRKFEWEYTDGHRQ